MWSSTWKRNGKRFASATAVLAAAVLLAGCGYGSEDDDAGAGGTTTRAQATWSGPPRPAEDGTLPVDEFNAYAETLPESKRVPRELALEYVRPRDPYRLTMSTRPGGSTVMVLRDNLEDDSVRAERYVLEFGLGSSGIFLGEARVEYQCQPKRGHQNFAPELCL